MTDAELFRVLVVLVLLLLSAHLVGRLFARLRLPPVIGEIVGGLLLGPSVLGVIAPGAVHWLLPKTGPVATAIGLVYQLGVLLLMFLAGAEMRTVFSKDSRRAIVTIALTGMVIPFGFGLLLAGTVDLSRMIGTSANVPALTLVIAVGIAVTSIPVISRIMMDLGIMHTAFARTVLSVAVMEDIVLNVVIAVAVGMVHQGTRGFGVVSLLGIDSRVGSAVYYALAALGFLAAAAVISAVFQRRRPALPAASGPAAALIGPVGRRLALILGASGVCVFLGIAPILGAFVVGLLTSREVTSGTDDSLRSIRGFSLAFFIPIYFAVVGFRLDLVHSFDLWLTLLFVAFACAVKLASVYLGARLSGRRPAAAVNLAFALNARGGPGIVLATLAYDAGIISATFFTTLVLTAVITSLMAGWWLEMAVSRGLLSRPAEFLPASRRPGGSDSATNSATDEEAGRL